MSRLTGIPYSPTVHKGEVPGLETLLQEILDRVWETTTQRSFTAHDILRLVREEGAILIFDGLDEKLVHLDETQGRAFLRALWHALPPFEARLPRAPAHDGRRQRADRSTSQRRRGRLIFSCRSHYFKTLRDQNAMLRGEDRDGVQAADYRAWVLLPFNETQIRAYLSRVLGPERVDAALALFESVHNLRELAERPYLLSLIATYIGELERRQARGDVVRGATLYELLIDEWLARDGGKHHLRPEDKLQLMEDIAADMWRASARAWEWRRVLKWLGQRLARDEVLRTRYNNIAPALLEEDFRTATFVLRPDDSQTSFRFAHTSLQEYFLARYLLRTLMDNEPENWAMPLPSLETLDFLGQVIAMAPDRQDMALGTIENLLGSYQPQATDIALRYWLQAVAHALPEPHPQRVDLYGADLSGWSIRGRSPTQPLNLVDANLAEARLVETRFEHVDLSFANLTSVQAERAEFHHVLAQDITVTEADMTAAIWRHCEALGLQGGKSAEWDACQWIACNIDPATLPDDFELRGVLSQRSTLDGPIPCVQGRELATVFGHTSSVNACSYSSDGASVVSAAGDHSVKIWDVRTGQCLRTLEGHTSGVLACGYSPDGASVVSASYDHSVKIWDAQTGAACLTLIHGPNGQTAALDEGNNRILAASPEAWRFLGWRYFDPQAGRLRMLPAEHFGPLPAG